MGISPVESPLSRAVVPGSTTTEPLFVYPLPVMKYAQLCFTQAAIVTTNHIDSTSETLLHLHGQQDPLSRGKSVEVIRTCNEISPK